MSKPVKKLFDLEIDEVSVVDRAANQHSLIAFSKSVESDTPLEGSMPDLAVYEETGEEVDVETLEHGDVVYDEAGNEFVFLEDAVDDDDDVEKGVKEQLFYRGQDLVGRGKQAAGQARAAGARARNSTQQAGRKARRKVTEFYTSETPLPGDPMNAKGNFPYAMGVNPRKLRAGRVAATGVGGAALAGAGGYGAYEASKSLGESVLEELSKAVTERDREAIIAKAMDEVEIAKADAQAAWEYAQGEADIRITQEFISKAATYNLPVAPEVLGPILKAMAEVLDEDELEIIDELFNAVGDALYNEVGYVGESSNSSVIDAVSAYANDLVGKSDLTQEQAMVAMLEANPSAYDAYINEKGI